MQTCLECETTLDIDEEEVEEGDIIPCDECGAEYEVVAKEPLELVRIDEDDLDEEEDDDFLEEEEEE